MCATIHIKKSSYKPIIIGKKGEKIKKISISARKDLEETLNKKFQCLIKLFFGFFYQQD